MTAALHLQRLHKAYGAVQAVNGLDLDVTTGECFGLLGPNGAGKTTTIEICEGLKPADQGEVLVLGRHWATDARWLRARIGVSLQETQFSDKLTVHETVTLFRSFYADGPGADAVLARVSLEEKRDARVAHLSGGQKQRLALARGVLAARLSDIVLLDEPTSSVDAKTEARIYESLFETFHDKSVVSVMHRLHLLARFDRIYVLERGRVAEEGTFQELLTSSARFQEMWRHQVADTKGYEPILHSTLGGSDSEIV